MHPRHTPLQHWECAALRDYAQRNTAFRAASPAAWFALRLLRVGCAEALLASAFCSRNLPPVIACAPPAPANLGLETRLYALFAE